MNTSDQEKHHKNYSILVVEDSATQAALVSHMLGNEEQQRFVFNVSCAVSLKQVRELTPQAKYDVILLDLNLPDSAGFDTFHAVRGLCPMIPIVIMSDITDEQMSMRAVKEGAQDYIFKQDLANRLLPLAIHQAIERHGIMMGLHRAQLQSETIVNSVTSGILIVGGDGVIRLANPAAEMMFGKAGESLCGKPFAFDIQSQKPTEIPLTRQDGTAIIVELRSNQADWGNGDKVNCVVATDISDHKALAHSLMEAREEAQKVAKFKSEFLSCMSHEIRTPMNGVIGITSLLLTTEMTQEQARYVNTIRSSGDTLLTIINDILDYSKIEAGKVELDLHEFNLIELAEETLEVFSEQAGNKNIELVSDITPEISDIVIGDSIRVRQILFNLIGNAVKFTAQGQVVLRISVENPAKGADTLRFDIIDSGIGINDEGKQKLFQSFSQVDRSTVRKYGGTGLGLAICKRLTELMHGQIGVLSEQGKGSDFWFTALLPKKEVRNSATAPHRTVFKGKELLLVDDNGTLRASLSLLLESWGWRVVGAADENSALAEIAKKCKLGSAFDAVLVDEQLGNNGTGTELFEKVKKEYSAPLANALLLIRHQVGEKALIDKAENMGFAGGLSKPLRQSALQQELLQIVTGVKANKDENARVVPKKTASDTIATAKKFILVVDDNPVNQMVTRGMVEKLGHQSKVVSNGNEAIKAFESTPFDAVLMDCYMPEMNGFTATEEIRKREKGAKRIPILAMTASVEAADRQRCNESGMDDFCMKPVKLEELDRLLKKWLVEPEAAASNKKIAA